MPGRGNATDKGKVGGINIYGVPGRQHVKQFLHKVMENKRKRGQRAQLQIHKDSWIISPKFSIRGS